MGLFDAIPMADVMGGESMENDVAVPPMMEGEGEEMEMQPDQDEITIKNLFDSAPEKLAAILKKLGIVPEDFKIEEMKGSREEAPGSFDGIGLGDMDESVSEPANFMGVP